MNIEPIPLLKDNYAWLLTQPDSTSCAVVDPSEADGVRAVLEKRGLKLDSILVTHHHWDHTGGIEGLVESWGQPQVIASRYDQEQGRVPQVSQSYGDNDAFDLMGERVECLMVPGHTLGAIAFYLPDSEALFTGDTLFTMGCGRLFEGTPAQMHESLSRLAGLPANTKVYCGHEYTQKNLEFALSLEPDSELLKERMERVKAARANNEPTVPETLRVEMKTNPFLRAGEESLASAVRRRRELDVFAEIRKRRDDF